MQSKIIEKINEIVALRGRAVIAIDGRCGSGKTSLAENLKKELSCNVIHMDDFFLRPEQRSEKRLQAPGENVDHERFLDEVLIPLRKGDGFYYRPFCCQTQSLGEEVYVEPSEVTVVEGSYSCHEKLWDYYDLHVFLDVDKNEQLKRIEAREGEEKLEVFIKKWIPLEEKYFEAFDIKNKCEICKTRL